MDEDLVDEKQDDDVDSTSGVGIGRVFWGDKSMATWGVRPSPLSLNRCVLICQKLHDGITTAPGEYFIRYLSRAK
jgi:hypothetical protein